MSDENNFPLYTQVPSPYPSLLQTTAWADDVYAGGKGAVGSYPCGLTIAQCGCAISSLVMGARYAGITEDILGDDVNPGNMNAYLDSVSGYTSVGELRWLAAQAYFGQLTNTGKIASRFAHAVQQPAFPQTVMSFINTALTDTHNVVLGYKNGHFVWVPEKTDTSYLVRDPWWYSTQTANDSAGDKIRNYHNSFDDARVFNVSDTAQQLSGSDIEVHLRGTAELLFKKASGEPVGYTNTGTVVVGLPNASYGNTEVTALNGVPVNSQGKHLVVYQAGDQFTLSVVGTNFGTYSLEFYTISDTGNVTSFKLSGVTIPGVTITYSIDLKTGKATEQPISYAQFLDILNREMVGYTDQQKAFFLKWVDKIYGNLDNKTTSQTIKSIEVYQKLLVAKKVTSPILTSVLDLLQQEIAKK